MCVRGAGVVFHNHSRTGWRTEKVFSLSIDKSTLDVFLKKQKEHVMCVCKKNEGGYFIIIVERASEQIKYIFLYLLNQFIRVH